MPTCLAAFVHRCILEGHCAVRTAKRPVLTAVACSATRMYRNTSVPSTAAGHLDHVQRAAAVGTAGGPLSTTVPGSAPHSPRAATGGLACPPPPGLLGVTRGVSMPHGRESLIRETSRGVCVTNAGVIKKMQFFDHSVFEILEITR